MRMPDAFTVFNRFSEAASSLRERRLIFETPERQQATPQRPERQAQNPVNMTQEQINQMINQALEQRLRGTQSVQASTTPVQGFGDRVMSVPGKVASFMSSPMSTPRHNTWMETGVTGTAIGVSALAGMFPAKFAALHPALGKFAGVMSGTLGSASAAASNALAAVGAPAELSFLASPWFLGLGAPLLGLGMLGKYRIHTLKAFYKNSPNKNDPKVLEALARIEEYENLGLVQRQISSVIEGSRLVAGTLLKPFSLPSKVLGYMTGRVGAFGAGIGGKLSNAAGILTSPVKNAKHLALGGLGGVGGGLVAGAAGAALLGAGVFAPWALVGGIPSAIWAYRRSKHGKGSSGAPEPA